MIQKFMFKAVNIVCCVWLAATIGSCSRVELIPVSSGIRQNCGTDSALAGCLTPKFSAEYYIDQGVKYFQTMQSDIPIDVIPNYSDRVIRWEWPPWLLLTGYKKDGLITTDILLKLNPTSYDTIDCRFFDTQPFCRCHVVFNYSGETCPIYEEFTFNDQGEITFIEAWSDFESLLPMGPGDDGIWDDSEYWGMKDVNRLATKIPGLGNETGLIDVNAGWMKNAAQADPDIREMHKRLKDPVNTWLVQLLTKYEELRTGCEPPPGDVFPYYEP
jgi:hypothetical protein